MHVFMSVVRGVPVILSRTHSHKYIQSSGMNMRMSFIGQVCLHIQGICYIDRSSIVQQNDCNRTGHRL